ncbi:MAG: transposase [Castellaniella sp.]
MSAMEVEDLIDAFGRAVIERAMVAEMNVHLGYRPGEDKPAAQTDERNGVRAKTLLTRHGSVQA